MTAAGTADERALRRAVLDALVVAPAHLVIDLRGFRGTLDLRRAVADIREGARTRRPAVTVDVQGLTGLGSTGPA
jgi:hypothetical protein